MTKSRHGLMNWTGFRSFVSCLFVFLLLFVFFLLLLCGCCFAVAVQEILASRTMLSVWARTGTKSTRVPRRGLTLLRWGGRRVASNRSCVFPRWYPKRCDTRNLQFEKIACSQCGDTICCVFRPIFMIHGTSKLQMWSLAEILVEEQCSFVLSIESPFLVTY